MSNLDHQYCSAFKKNGDQCIYKAKKNIDHLYYCKIHWKQYINNQSNNQILEYSIDDNAECSICLNKIFYSKRIKLCMTCCCHIFHLNCINKWILDHNSCPICRFQQNRNDLIIICKPLTQYDNIVESLKNNFQNIIKNTSYEKLLLLNDILISFEI